MQKVKKYLKILLGSLLIAVSLNLFFIGEKLLPAGVLGLAVLFEARIELDLGIIILIANLFFLLCGILCLSVNKVKKALVPFALIPFLCYITRDIGSMIDVSSVDILLKTIYGGVLAGLGYRFIYKENCYVSGSDIISTIENEITGMRLNIINYVLDVALVLLAIHGYGFENSMYSLIAIIIIETLSKRASLGTSDSKVFYIITKRDKEVSDYIIDELHYTLTVFDVKGGFLKTKNTVLMAVIPTKDYYKLKEGVKAIDPKAFISITDSYEVINGKVTSQKNK